jgi:hypothetical protein
MMQTSLFERDTRIVSVARRGTIAERFSAFHASNPGVYRALVMLARDMHEMGRRRLGIKMLWEKCRWELMLATTSEEGRKLNNDFSALYAREIMRNEPDLAGIFETRTRRAA